LNPALGMTVTTYNLGLIDGLTIKIPSIVSEAFFAKFIWVYMVFPFIGSILAALVIKPLNNAYTKMEKEEENY